MRRSLALALVAMTGVLASPAAAHGQVHPVLLQIRPRVGDTLRLRVDQMMEMEGTTKVGKGDTTTTETTSLLVFTRIAIESNDTDGTIMLATTDSVRLTTTAAGAASGRSQPLRAMEGQRVRLKVTPDGSTSIANPEPWTPSDLQALFAQMPATLPKEPIAPGSSWSRGMEIPLAATSGEKGNAMLTAVFHFDSLTRGGDLAWITVKGRLTRTESAPTSRNAASVATSGTVAGSILVDRRRGWITDAKTVITVRSLVQPPGRNVVRVRMKITQWMKAH